jgi:hypothetical protein
MPGTVIKKKNTKTEVTKIPPLNLAQVVSSNPKHSPVAHFVEGRHGWWRHDALETKKGTGNSSRYAGNAPAIFTICVAPYTLTCWGIFSFGEDSNAAFTIRPSNDEHTGCKSTSDLFKVFFFTKLLTIANFSGSCASKRGKHRHGFHEWLPPGRIQVQAKQRPPPFSPNMIMLSFGLGMNGGDTAYHNLLLLSAQRRLPSAKITLLAFRWKSMEWASLTCPKDFLCVDCPSQLRRSILFLSFVLLSLLA